MRSDDKTEETDSKIYSDDPRKPTAADENLPDDTANCVRIAHLRLTYGICSIKKRIDSFFS